MKQAVESLAALAQESRLRVFRRLVVAGAEGGSAGTLAKTLKIPPATLSFHLKTLAATGLIQHRREGRSLIYGLNPAAMQQLLAFLTEDCCLGREDLCQPTSVTKRGRC